MLARETMEEVKEFKNLGKVLSKHGEMVPNSRGRALGRWKDRVRSTTCVREKVAV